MHVLSVVPDCWVFREYLAAFCRAIEPAAGRPAHAMRIPLSWEKLDLVECEAENGDSIEFSSHHDDDQYLVVRTQMEEHKRRRQDARIRARYNLHEQGWE